MKFVFIFFCLCSSAAFAGGVNFNDTDNQALSAGVNPDFSVNVGIGSANPGQLLDVQGTVRALFLSGNGSALSNITTTQWTTTNTNDVYLPNNGNVGLGTTLTSTSALTVMNGNVGIGTWAPQYLFQVNGNIGIGTINTKIVTVSIGQINMATVIGSQADDFFGGAGNTTTTVDNTVGMGQGALANLGSGGGTDAALGFDALNNINTGTGSDTAVGYNALVNLTGTEADNTAVGYSAGQYYANTSNNLTQATNSTFIGYQTMAAANNDNNETVIGANAVGNGSNTFTLGGTGTLDTIIPFGNIGIGTSLTKNALDVSTTRGVSIGTAYAGYITAPTNGLLVQGNVGIGSAAPGQALDVTGTVRTTNFTMSGQSPISGYVLTASDSTGDTTWSSPGAVSGWTVTGNDVYETAGGNVGIGTTLVTTAALTVMNGNVGIGTWVPAKPFSVTGDTYYNGNVGIGTTKTTTAALTIMTGNVGIGTWVAGDLLFVNGAMGGPTLYSDGAGDSWGGGVLKISDIQDGTDTALIELTATGSVGIGTSTPGSTFSVLGGVGIGSKAYAVTYKQTNGLAVEGNVGIGTFNPFGGSLIVNGGNNVGIGSLTPGQLLDVQGTVRDTGNITNGNVGIGTSFINGTGEAALTVMNGNVGIGTWVVTNGHIQGPHNASAVGQAVCWGTNSCLGYCTAGVYPACSTCTCF